MKKITKRVGYVLFFLLFIWATVRIQFCWFEWFHRDWWTKGLIVAICLSIGSVVLSVLAGIRVVKQKSFLFALILLVWYLLMLIFCDRIGVFISDLFIPIGPGILPEDIFQTP